jgi:hypothetical protein
MPTPSTAVWPKPKSEDEFEDIVVDAMRSRWDDPNAQRYGRRGQAQHGVDVVGQSGRSSGIVVGAQCKNTESLSLAVVIAEVEKAKTYPGGLAELYVVTSAERDARLQDNVREYFAKSPAPFRVEVMFWDDVTSEVAKDPDLVWKHWNAFARMLPGGERMERRQRIALLLQRMAALEGQQVQTPGYLWIARGHETGHTRRTDEEWNDGLADYMGTIDLESVRAHLRHVLEIATRLAEELDDDTVIAEEVPDVYLKMKRALIARARILQDALTDGVSEHASEEYGKLIVERDETVERLVQRLSQYNR